MLNKYKTFTKDKTTGVELNPVFKIEYDNYKLKEVVSNAVETLEIKDNRTKAMVTFVGVTFITLASKVPMTRIANLESDILKSNVLDGMQMFTGANYQVPSIFSLGVAPVVSAGILLNLLKKVFPKLEDSLNEVYNQHQVRVIKRGLTFLIGLGQSLVLSNITNGGVLVAVVMALGGVLMGVITDYMTDHGLINGNSAVIGASIINNILGGGIKSIILSPLMVSSFLRLHSSHIRIPTRNRKGRKGYIPFKIFSAGTLPIILASSIVSIVAFFAPSLMLQFSWIVAMIQAMMIYLLNHFENKVNYDTVGITKELRRKSIGIVNSKSKLRTKDVLDETVSTVSSVSGIMLVIMGILPMVFGASSFINVSSLFVLSGIVYELIVKFKSESVVKNRHGFLSK